MTDIAQPSYPPGAHPDLPAPRRMLEIGIANGASLRAWRSMWPGAYIYGLDLDTSRLPFKPDDHMEVLEGDATSRIFDIHDLDLIVDDGSHLIEDQLMARALLWKSLLPGGTYVIEDVFPENVNRLMLPDWRLLVTGRGYDDRLIWWRHA